MQNKKVQKNWDLTYATFFWRLYWRQGKEYSTSSSKVWGEPEAADKDMVLFRCIEMLINRGWLQKTHRIEFYKKQGAIIQLQNDPLIGTLYPDHYEFNQKYVVQYHEDYLRDVYTALNTGVGPPEGSKYKPVRKIKNNPLDQAFALAKKTTYASKALFIQAYQYFKSCGIATGELEAFEYAIKRAQSHLFYQYENHVDKSMAEEEAQARTEKKLTPAAEFYKDVPGSVYYQNKKEDMQAAADRVRAKYDIKKLPAGVTLKFLLQQELQNANNNLNK